VYAAGEEVVRVEAQLSAYYDESDLWMVNACAADFPVKVKARMLAFLATAQKLVEEFWHCYPTCSLSLDRDINAAFKLLQAVLGTQSVAGIPA